ncbi:U3 small nucleolar RNA-associated protein 11 [Biomphalaria glabrata]|uniref:U3 small nucleolar RNA-associated protein 11 n=1 Tax=Biomphalaria glabrata TaxID=6526 RepID=A0A9W3AJ32_BIOGL|nr:probable U3 small nucleolar RNA-associated protein 11 [Biomphalaria glabrata]XP_055887287.1 probable U3 small nucleolar RNA-associated protein 11 [Biomphalaria glabrata]KAI8749654.1 putative U3 small nucleolar RNA-associated protein 11 [Biomphalaria glabrata]
MSSWKKNKTQKVHRERPQPEDRAHLGMLERKKDYRERAKDFHKKEETIKKLKRKAENRNPDEFYFNMTRTKRLNGDHKLRKEAEPVVTEEQKKMMATQDRRYVLFRLSKELKKIEKLKKTLHMIDSDQKKNSHVIFVDSKEEAKHFDAAKFFDTHPAFIDRAFNRPKMETLKTGQFVTEAEQLQAVMEAKDAAYKEMTRRMDRAKELKIIADKLEAKLHTLDKSAKKKCIQQETKKSAAQYVFSFKRQK